MIVAMARHTPTRQYLCGKPTVDGGRCRRAVSAPGANCGVAHRPPLTLDETYAAGRLRLDVWRSVGMRPPAWLGATTAAGN
jgi:hypothetical protein